MSVIDHEIAYALIIKQISPIPVVPFLSMIQDCSKGCMLQRQSKKYVYIYLLFYFVQVYQVHRVFGA